MSPAQDPAGRPACRLFANLDRPAGEGQAPGALRALGWCFAQDGEIRSLDLVLDGRRFRLRTGLERADVAAQFPDAEHALLSGFEGLAEAGRGRHTLALEAELVDGRRGRLALPQALLVQSAGPPVWRRAAGLPAFLWRRWRERREAARGLPPLAEWPGKLRRLLLAYRPGGAAPGGFRPEAPLEPYAAWLAVNPWGERQARSLRERCAALPAGPGWAVLTAVPPGQERELLGCWEALEAQAHGDFQWRVAMDPSRVPDWLAAAARTPRVALFAPGPDAAAALNAAAGAAGGVLMLDVRDRLHPSALGELACELAASAAPWFYADDDQRPPGGGAQPRFKPDWSPVLLLSSPYCGPTLALRPGVLEAAGGVRGGYGEAWHYDLALRLAESQGPAGHVPLVLSHLGGWGPDREAAADAARALEAALARRGIRAGVRQHGWAREGRLAAFALEFPDDGPSVAVLIPTRNRPDLLGPCLRSLGATTYRNHRVIVLDNHNDDPRAAALLKAHGSVLAAPDLAGEGFSYAGLHNRAVAQVDAEHLVFLNDDTRILDPRWLSQMVGYAGLAGVGSVGARLAYPGGPLQHAGIRPGMNQGMVGHAFRMAGRDDPGPQGLAGLAREVSGGTAACLLTPRRLFLELGGFDEKAFPVGYNDVDYNWRLMDRGYACLYVPDALVEHHESATRSPLNRPSENAALRRRYRLRRDPYWSAHASPEADGLEPRPTRLAREPRRRVRVAMVSHLLDLSGAPRNHLETLLALRDQGWMDPVLLSPQDGPLRAVAESEGLEVALLEDPTLDAAGLEGYQARLDGLAGRFRSLGAELVWANTLPSFWAVDAAQRAGLPSLWNVRETEPWEGYFNYLPDPIAARALACLGLPYRVFVGSRATARALRPLDGRRRLSVVNEGLDVARFHRDSRRLARDAARARLGVGAGEVVLLALGTVCPRKGQRDLLGALERMPPALWPRLRCFVVGGRDNPYNRDLLKRAGRLPDGLRGRFHVVEETLETGPYWAAADVFVHCSRAESWSRVVLEAMAMGLPIVATPAPGVPEQARENENALFYPDGDAPALARLLARLLEDPVERGRLAAASPVVLAGLRDLDEMARVYADALFEALLSV